MATRIIEFAEPEGNFPALPRVLAEQPALVSTGSAQNSAVFNSATKLVCVQSDEAVNVSLTGDATANSYKLQAGGEQFWVVQQGQTRVSIK